MQGCSLAAAAAEATKPLRVIPLKRKKKVKRYVWLGLIPSAPPRLAGAGVGRAEPGLKWWWQHLVPLHVPFPGFVLSIAVEQLPAWRVPHLLVPTCLFCQQRLGRVCSLQMPMRPSGVEVSQGGLLDPSL